MGEGENILYENNNSIILINIRSHISGLLVFFKWERMIAQHLCYKHEDVSSNVRTHTLDILDLVR